MTCRRIAIIGAGVSGLTSIKACLDEGLDPVCFEREDGLGGLWRYSDDAWRPSVYKSCVINTSKEMMSFSDFPVPKDFPPFLPHQDVLRYLSMYADRYGLRRHVRFARRVLDVRPVPGDGPRWSVTTSGVDGETTEEFDGVMLASGHLWSPHQPTLDGLGGNFKGRVLHSAFYRRPDDFHGKRVLVVGIGNSAADIAVDISRVASKVFVSTRRGAWVVGRMGPFGLPMDALANCRLAFMLPRQWLQWLVEKMANFKFDHHTYGLQARHRALESHPTISDDLPMAIMTGKVVVVDNVRQFTDTSAVLDNGHVLEDIDVVVLATGYTYSYNYIDNDLLGLNTDNDTSLYKYVYSTRLDYPHSLAVVGLVQPIGAIMPCSEIQARWAARLFKGDCQLPNRDEMMADIELKKSAMESRYYGSKRHKLETFWIQYMDEIAAQVGCRPEWSRLIRQDPLMALRCLAGPCVPAQYRLYGPGSQPQLAKDIIMNTLTNSVYALNMHRSKTDASDDNNNPQRTVECEGRFTKIDKYRRQFVEAANVGMTYFDELVVLVLLFIKLAFTYVNIADHIIRFSAAK